MRTLQRYFNIRPQTHAPMRSILTARWLYPALITLAVFVVSLTTFIYPALAIRPFLVLVFLLVCPGLTVVRFFQLHEVIIEWLLALALSIAIDAFVAGVLLYSGRWSPIHIFTILLSLCLVGAIFNPISSLVAARLYRACRKRRDKVARLRKGLPDVFIKEHR